MFLRESWRVADLNGETKTDSRFRTREKVFLSASELGPTSQQPALAALYPAALGRVPKINRAQSLTAFVKACRMPALTRRWCCAVGRRRTSLEGGNREMPRGGGENGLRGYGDLKARN